MLNAVPEPVAPEVPVTVTVWLWVELALIAPEVPVTETVWVWFAEIVPVFAGSVCEWSTEFPPVPVIPVAAAAVAVITDA
jgi:hypothetical protein